MNETGAGEFTLRAIDPRDERIILDAYDLLSMLGEDYLPLKDLVHHAQHHVVAGAFAGEELLGVVVACPLSAEDFKTLEKRMNKDRFESLALPREGGTGTIDALAVRKDWRRIAGGEGPGIGTRLILEATGRLKDLGCELILAESWVSESGDESRHLLERQGAEFRFEVPG